ncbi:MAG: hypothetical protein ABI625_18055, partial [bacterium]
WWLSMSRAFFLLAIVFVSACSSTILFDAPSIDDAIVTTDGPVRLTVTDALSQAGVLWARPTATASQSTVSVTNTRYGSTCLFSLTGHADVGTSTITLVIGYSQRLTSCTKELRSLTYRADISGLAKAPYDLVVIHDESGKKDTVLTQHLVVP